MGCRNAVRAGALERTRTKLVTAAFDTARFCAVVAARLARYAGRALHAAGALERTPLERSAPVRPHRRAQPLRACVFLLLAACAAPETFADVCAQANNQVETCGATVPALKDSPCTGLAKFVSTCITQQAASCDELAALMRDPSRCFPDGGDDVYPGAEELPLPNSDSPDAGASTP